MVIVRLYGWLAERLGWRERELGFEGDLLNLLVEIDTGVKEMVESGKLLVAVNHQIIRDLGIKVRANDIVAVLPAFSGGSLGKRLRD
ncbi:MAG: MoaD/ThiS family protein [Candidatus Korarchaeota archaeon]|nr:MoaD/ThiS family protein [Candidatus Korarchaeota archaeon]